MCQRVVIALALACRPQLLIADEPTTGLDVTTQKTVMDLIVELTRERGMSTILITHDLGLAATYCDRVVVMEKGQVVETAPSRAIFTAPAHPYTRKLMRATPRPGADLRDLLPAMTCRTTPARTCRRPPAGPAATRAPLLVVEKLVKEYPRKGSAGGFGRLFKRGRRRSPSVFRAVDGISFTVDRGESVGLVGESGCGKSTTSTMVMRLIDKTDGTHHVRRRGHRRHPGQAVRQAAAAQAHPDGVPGPDRQPQPALHGRARHRRSDPAARRRPGRARRAGALRGAGRARSACRSTCSTASRTSSPAGRRRASASRAPSRSTPIWSSSTSRPRRSTSRCRRWCSTCCRTSRTRSG